MVLGPTLAPLLGGYVSEELSWRWIFFILVPMAFIALLGLLLFVKEETGPDRNARLDWTGFLSLSICVSCIQLVLDRGERLDWFASAEIVIETFVAGVSGWVFLVHSLTADRPFIDLRLLINRNFAVGLGIAFLFGSLFVTPMVLLPVLLQQLRDIPEFIVALLIAGRGLGTFTSQVMVVFLTNHIGPRPMLLIGFGAHTLAGLQMVSFDVNVTLEQVAIANMIQGFGVGFLWVPITLVLFSNFDPDRTPEGSGIFHFVRSVGSSYFISGSFVLAFHTEKMNYANLVQWISPFSETLRNQVSAAGGGMWTADSQVALMALSSEVTRQAVTIGFLNAFHLFMWASLLVYPLIALVAWPPRSRSA